VKYVWDAFKDWKIYVHMLITIGIYTPLYSISLFLPTIVRNMGYSYVLCSSLALITSVQLSL